jgi:hypothetical protein
MLSSFTVTYTIVALLIFPQPQKQNTKTKTAMLYRPKTQWLQARTPWLKVYPMDDYIFQQDGAIYHKSKVIQEHIDKCLNL